MLRTVYVKKFDKKGYIVFGLEDARDQYLSS